MSFHTLHSDGMSTNMEAPGPSEATSVSLSANARRILSPQSAGNGSTGAVIRQRLLLNLSRVLFVFLVACAFLLQVGGTTPAK